MLEDLIPYEGGGAKASEEEVTGWSLVRQRHGGRHRAVA
jgi:hypothetical protein